MDAHQAPLQDTHPETSDLTTGLLSEEARARLRLYGPNVLPPPRPVPLWHLALSQLTHFFAMLLWVAAVVAFVAGMPKLATAIVAIILLNGLFAFFQEYRAERAAARLQSLLPSRIIVRRDGQTVTVEARELVPGDVVILQAGDRVPADIVLAEVEDFALDVLTFTGESVPANPAAGEMAFAGTFVMRGLAVGDVIATGTRTRLGGVAHLTQAPAPDQPRWHANSTVWSESSVSLR